ncbi:MAG: hypothetical protein ACJ75B_10780 [Flavisolibacter sp.]|jgi:hypothetical protein
MQTDFNKLTLSELRALYLKADEELRAALIDGASWEQAKEKRTAVTELAIHIYKKIEAEKTSRTLKD